jgi:hypothetical protein
MRRKSSTRVILCLSHLVPLVFLLGSNWNVYVYLVVGWSEAKMVLICELVFRGNILVWCYICRVFFYSLLLLYQLIWNLLKAIYRRNKQHWKQESKWTRVWVDATMFESVKNSIKNHVSIQSIIYRYKNASILIRGRFEPV